MPIEEIQDILEEYFAKHPLALECGSEYVAQDDEAQSDALEAFYRIVDKCVQ